MSARLWHETMGVQILDAKYEYLPDVDGEPFRDQEVWQAWAASNASEGVAAPQVVGGSEE